MSNHLFLPRLTQISFQLPKEVGIWDGSNDKATLNTIAKDIPVGSAGPINSIPDIWARPVMFSLFLPLQEKDDPVPQRIRQEWRGLLSVLALREVSGLNVEFAPVDVRKIGVDPLKQPLLRLKPRPVKWGGVSHDWEHLFLIRVRKDDEVVCLGAFSPTTLVFAGSDYSARMKPKVAAALGTLLARDEQGRSLLRAPDGFDKRAKALLAWLKVMKTRVGSLDPQVENAKSTILLNELQGWITELTEKGLDTSGYEVVPPQPAENKVTEAYPLYSQLCWRVQAPKREEKGLFSLRRERVLDAAVKDVLIVWPSLFREHRQAAETDWGLFSPLVVRGGDPEADLEKWFPGESGTEFAGQKLEGALWIRPEQFFFCDKLLCTKERKPWLTGETLSSNASTILPLRKSILDHFSSETVWRALRPRIMEKDGRTKVTIDLPVGTGTGTVEISREYGPADTVEIDPIPIEVFPRYMGPDWLRYYVVSGENLTIECKAATPPERGKVESRTFHRAGDDGRPGAVIERLAAAGGSDGTGAFPEAISLRRREGELGLLLLKRDARAIEKPARWKVGIDFGTTNTNIWVEQWESGTNQKIGEAGPMNVDLGSFFRPLAKSSNTEERAAWLKYCFLSPEKLEMPIASAVRVTGAQDPEILATTFAHFMTDLKVPADVKAPIKFGNKELQAAYFDSLLILLLLAGRSLDSEFTLRKADLRFTYPKVFSRDEKQQFVATWKDRIDRLYGTFLSSWEHLSIGEQVDENDSGDFESPGKESYLPKFLITEGAAAARFFTSDTVSQNRANLLHGVACVDVGGGTTDFTLWRDGEVAYDTSVMLAGQTITRYVRARPSLWTKLFSEDISRNLQESHSKGLEGQFGLYLNFGLTSENSTVLRKLGACATDMDLAWLKRMILFQFSSVAYFAGVAAGRDSQIVENAREGNNPAFWWGGRAAQFLNWLDGGTYLPTGITARLLETIYFQSFGNTSGFKLTAKPRFSLSDKPKAEAAGGVLVSDRAYRDKCEAQGLYGDDGDGGAANNDELIAYPPEDGQDERAASTKVLAGDEIKLASGTISFKDEVSEAQLFKGSGTKGKLSVRNLPLTELGRFVYLCNVFFGKAGFIKNETENFAMLTGESEQARNMRTQVQSIVLSELEKEAIKPIGKRVLEPVFFSEVRAFIGLMLARL